MKVILTITILLFSSFSSIVTAEDEDSEIECTILTDWDYDFYLLDDDMDEGWNNISNIATSVIHKYVVEFSPPFVNGSTPHLVSS
jgi:hypothetical protein